MPCVLRDSESSREKFDVAQSRRGCCMSPSSKVDDYQRADGDAVCATIQKYMILRADGDTVP